MAQEKQKIRFKDLSGWLKLSAIGSWIVIATWIINLFLLILFGLLFLMIT